MNRSYINADLESLPASQLLPAQHQHSSTPTSC